MSTAIYLAIMLSVVALLVAAIVPSLFFPKCPDCGVRNLLDTEKCRGCGKALIEKGVD